MSSRSVSERAACSLLFSAFLLGILLLGTLLLGAPGPSPLFAQDAEPYETPIVFQRSETAQADGTVPEDSESASLWIMEDDGSRLQLFRAAGGQRLDHPSLSDDLQNVLYAEFEPGATGPDAKARLLMESIGVKADGSSVRRVVRNVHTCSVHHASVSPVTRELTYMRYCENIPPSLISEMNYEIRDVSLATNGLLASHGVGLNNAVIFQAEEPVDEGERRSAIALVRYDDRGAGTYSELTDRKFFHQRPAVSSDGEWIAWQSNNSQPGTDDLFLAKVDGKRVRRLTQSAANDGHPWFSRDGKWIAFESDRTGHWEIFKINLASGDVVQLTDDPALHSTRPRY